LRAYKKLLKEKAYVNVISFGYLFFIITCCVVAIAYKVK